jgi:hypothetical protein
MPSHERNALTSRVFLRANAMTNDLHGQAVPDILGGIDRCFFYRVITSHMYQYAFMPVLLSTAVSNYRPCRLVVPSRTQLTLHRTDQAFRPILCPNGHFQSLYS